ncbi:MAG TPA: restriction endonuclease subunit S [Mycobacterium sp.]|nr:restriction endonuclease subunit S [Mycobacterium sp.]
MTWRERRVADLAELVNGHPFESADFADEGAVPLVRIRDILSKPFQTFVSREVVPEAAVVRDGDVVVGMDGDFNLVYWTRGPAALNQRLCLLRSNGQADTRFLAYALPSHLKVINDLTYSTTVKHLASGQVRGIKMLAPDVSEQRAIADYLDRETARIDALIEEQQRLIELLRERRTAAADAELGARVGSGSRLKWFVNEVDLRSDSMAEDLPLMSVSIDWGVRRRDQVTADEARADDLSNYKVCRQGDLVINRMRAFQGALGLAPEDGIVSPDYAVLRAVPPVDSEWLAGVMKTDRFVREMASRIRGIGSAELGSARTPRINVRDMCEILLDVPDGGKQAREVQAMRRLIGQIDTLIVETETFIELARERRAALITAVVTGQIDVRGRVA